MNNEPNELRLGGTMYMTSNKCGCGETYGVTTVVMTDRLWSEFFFVEGATRPDSASACRSCISDWNRYAGPLVPVGK